MRANRYIFGVLLTVILLLLSSLNVFSQEVWFNKKGEISDFESIAEWSIKASKRNQYAQFNMGMMYVKGRGVEQDDTAATNCFKKAAEQGVVEAQYYLGLMYEQGRGVDQDDTEAANWIKKAAEQGYLPARCTLAGMYRDGRGVKQNVETAIALYDLDEFSLDQETSDELCHYGYAVPWEWRNALCGIKQNISETIQRLEEDDSGCSKAILAWMYEYGYGVSSDVALAAKWFKAAEEYIEFSYYPATFVRYDDERMLLSDACQGDVIAQYSLGVLYESGNDYYCVPQSRPESIRWLQEADKQGFTPATYIIGCKYKEGRGVEQNYTEALKWLKKAAENGNDMAQNTLGTMYYQGDGVKQDYSEAIKWYKMRINGLLY